MDSKKKEVIYGACLLLLSGISICFGWGIRQEEEAAAKLRAENDRVVQYAENREAPGDSPFTAGRSALLQAAADISASGISLQEIREEPPETKAHGVLWTMKICGAGSFFQVLSLFDIIHMKKNWISASLCRIQRRGDSLFFEMELAAYQGKESSG